MQQNPGEVEQLRLERQVFLQLQELRMADQAVKLSDTQLGRVATNLPNDDTRYKEAQSLFDNRHVMV